MLNYTSQDEKLFGFHSEYYIPYNWGESFAAVGTREGYGYSKISDYQGDVYFLARRSYDYEGTIIVKCDLNERRRSIIKIKTKENYKYIAVNQQGIFLYNEQKVALYGFDGVLYHSQKYANKSRYGENNITTCVYVYDSYFYYADVKSTGRQAIARIDMINKTSCELWSSEKGDEVLEDKIRREFFENHGEEYPERAKITNITRTQCFYLYANGNRVIAGFKRGMANYTVNVSLEENGEPALWDVLQCRIMGDEPYPAIFSFDMLSDVMWVQHDMQNNKKRLFSSSIFRLSRLKGQITIKWGIPYIGNTDTTVHFDGNAAYASNLSEVYSIRNDGATARIYHHFYQTEEIFFLGEWILVPNEDDGIDFFNVIQGKGFRATGDSIKNELDSAIELSEKAKPKVQNSVVNTQQKKNIEKDLADLGGKVLEKLEALSRYGRLSDEQLERILDEAMQDESMEMFCRKGYGDYVKEKLFNEIRRKGW